ncbi:DNA polymerase III subunit delta' [Caldifermentibacillus hisashii]|uniref:DNA polymerase III subunit delta' n=1 Tax=Caldifermentibacillus hisashii TaxID=996558 RepID=UPI002E21058C|nr:DNA polymerase III subunit delta' [Caldifermentibacillus hisashii]MED3642058.1 DNA polymerase III subunit delta' [Caldifermentibacillus hisashii]
MSDLNVRTWDELEKYQPTVMKMLKQIIIKNRIAHAYLFEGMKGTVKKEIGLLLAKALFCEQPFEGYKPCENCPQCKRINHGNHPDIHLVEPDGNSIKKEQIYFLQQEFSKKAVESNRKFYMIIHADKMTTNAANSLLKFLEEPGQNTTAILVTEQIQKILPTIFSRCQHITFYPLPKPELIKALINHGVKKDRAPLLANLTNSLDEALQMNEDQWFLQARDLVLKLYEIKTKQTIMDTLLFLQTDWLPLFKSKEQIDVGLDMLLFIYKDLLYIQLEKVTEVVYPDYYAEWQKNALKVSGNRLTEQISLILDAKRRLQSNVNGLLLMEQLMIKL